MIESRHFTNEAIADESWTLEVLNRRILGLTRVRVVFQEDRNSVAEACREALAAWPSGAVADAATAYLEGK